MSSSPAPKPMPMAIMRNAHEVIRGATKDIQSLLDQGDLKEATKLWQDLVRFQTVHLHMEEGVPGVAGGMFQLMDDHADQTATKAGLRDEHSGLEDLEQQVHACLVTKPDLKMARQVFPKFAEHNEAHLLKEEQVMMPCVQQMVKKGHPVKKYIGQYLMPLLTRNDDELEFFLKFANQVLERHDNGPRVRVFDQALWAVATPEQWSQWKVWIEQALSPTKYENVMGQIQAFVEEQKALKMNQVPKVMQPKWMALMKNPVEC